MQELTPRSLEGTNLQATNLFNVTGWVAIVTGGGTGLGLITAVSLLANGAARVYITGRREDVLRRAAETHSKSQGVLIPFACDVTVKEDIRKLVSFVAAREKCVNLLVNNAGIGGIPLDIFTSSDPEEISRRMLASDLQGWDDTLHINTSAIFFTSVALLPLLVAARDTCGSPGSILNISSMAGITKLSMGGQFAYNTAKAATISLTQQLAYEFRTPTLGVRVNTLAPGYFPSGMLPADNFSENPAEVREKWSIPAGRPGNITDYAQVVLSLAVNEYINGSTLLIDGGWLLEESQTWPFISHT